MIGFDIDEAKAAALNARRSYFHEHYEHYELAERPLGDRQGCAYLLAFGSPPGFDSTERGQRITHQHLGRCPYRGS